MLRTENHVMLSPMRRTTKRGAKPTHACTSCRKHKTRCEILDPSMSPVRCHRCKVLSVECSYEHTQVPVAPAESSKPLSPVSSRRVSLEPSKHMLWSYVASDDPIDWSAPMLAIQNLSLSPSEPTVPTESSSTNTSLSGILPEFRIDYLIDLFNEKYTPWLNFQPMRKSKNPLVDIVSSAVAARHLDGAAGKKVRLRLEALAHDSVAQMIFSPGAVVCLEAVQCLLILSLWGPFGVDSELQEWDTRRLISEAVRMAVSLHLDHASAVVDDMRRRGSESDRTNLRDASEHARLWIAITNAESMLSLGTGSSPSSRRTPSDYQLVKFPAEFNAQTDLRDVRLGLTGKQFDLFEEGAKMCLPPGREEGWAQQIKGVLQRMDHWYRLLNPLPLILDTDKFYFHALRIYHEIARLLVFYHAFKEARTSVLPHTPIGQAWHNRFMSRTGGQELLDVWGREMVRTAERILIAALAAPAAGLSTAPDALFTMIALAAGYLVGVKFLMLQRPLGRLPGATDLILARIVTHLHCAACGPGHAAQRCALLIRSLVAKWEMREERDVDTAAVPQPTSSPTPPAGSIQFPLSPLGSLGVPGELRIDDPSGVDVEFFFLNSMLSDDTGFWDSLAQEELTW
ncbi:hypothetical protein DFH09DRAFT_1377675 [Mycena vulgaris]|nr:hypothetical protein DFH09DRAFT_1377675 [Mycena vulgaris]